MAYGSGKTNTLIGFSLIASVGLALLYAGGVYSINALAQEAVDLEAEIQKISVEGNDIRKQTTILNEIAPIQGDLKQYFINRDNVVPFNKYLRSLGSTAGVGLSYIPNQGSDELSIVFNFQGGFDNCMHFISLVESLPYNVVVENVFVEKTGEKEEVEMWSGGMTTTLPGSGTE